MKAAVVTISDGCYHGKREDHSSRALHEILTAANWQVTTTKVLPDEIPMIQKQLMELADHDEIDLIVTTGGTGLGPRDVTPEAMLPLLDKQVPGLAELMRFRGLEKTEFAALSRSIAGARNRTLILGLPGSPKGAAESLQAVLQILPHAVDLLHGHTAH